MKKYTFILLSFLAILIIFKSNVFALDLYSSIESYGWPTITVTPKEIETQGIMPMDHSYMKSLVTSCEYVQTDRTLYVLLSGYILPFGGADEEYYFSKALNTELIDEIYLINKSADKKYLMWKRVKH